jgi:membrane protein implicated in regulation of membrane protease activity
MVLAALLYVGEMLTTTFFLLPFGLAATAALLANLFGAALWLQWVTFVVTAVIALVFLRPLFKRMTSKAIDVTAGVDRLIGMTGTIIDGNAPSGENRARVAREVWNVSTESGEHLPVGTMVKVLRVEGVHLIIEIA